MDGADRAVGRRLGLEASGGERAVPSYHRQIVIFGATRAFVARRARAGSAAVAQGSSIGAVSPAVRVQMSQIGRISISEASGIGFGQRFTHATASSIDGSSHNQ